MSALRAGRYSGYPSARVDVFHLDIAIVGGRAGTRRSVASTLVDPSLLAIALCVSAFHTAAAGDCIA